ncbi:heat shock protein 75 kDa, putative [Pediculus humanus corporis]|uniref:Heat shock protein 75 kDa, mitochondrial n=1 Tax=Pediculus humanus subsp. corporis TaxID=121224 RepID=E0VHX6_PEDHC|nr:heat shock protein 75 kDa, putative [Pediculus humanus corporis]EEB12982.1 heat shock protein 75 kDa, putative [Pediculus humanus corporis]
MALRNFLRIGRQSKLIFYNRAFQNISPIETVSRLGGIQSCYFSQESQATKDVENDFHSIIKDTEKTTGDKNTHEFKAETKMLLDIVAKSLYSDKEVFIRELISNASDALEKLRYTSLSEGKSFDTPLEIHIGTDKQNRIITIQDTGIGMTKEELVSNLGTIARSGSKSFIEKLKEKGPSTSSDVSSIIGQFGVGFYSSFMVAEKVEVYTKSHKENSVGYKWSTDGSGTYDIQEAEGVQEGTKIIIHLKIDCREFSDENTVKNVIQKYSNFVGSPIFVNGKQVNTIQPLWLKDAKEVTKEQHDEFFRYIGNTYDRPRFTLHYKTDSPMMIRALLYFPDGKPGLFELSRDADLGVSLYTKKVLIKSRAENILPKWLRFVKGVVDSEDIPLNLSRELLQNSALIAKLRYILTTKVLKFLQEKLVKEPEEYEKFHQDYGLFIKEGIVTTHDVLEKEEIAKLLKFEFSTSPPGVKKTLTEYVENIKDNRKDIYYLAAPSRELAESSPYFESLKKQNIDVLFCYEPYDELVFMHLREFGKCRLVSLEKEMRDDKSSDATDLGSDIIKGEIDNLKNWLKSTLAGKIHSVKTTNRLQAHPCVVTVEEMASARQFLRQQATAISEESKYALLKPQLEINPKHPIIKKLCKLKNSNPKLADLVAKQLFSNAMVSAGLLEDPRIILTDMNELLTQALEIH